MKNIKEQEVMTGVKNVISFIKERLKNDMIEASNKNLINIEKSELGRTFDFIDQSIDASFFKSSQEIIEAIKK
tara:strand:+ start:230 stop:448 length:219 start_codon:yes stop_codon:yes gene_type:complete